ncbi:MAG: hypothetical protein WD226_00495 [Planctomycetota bacterium]
MSQAERPESRPSPRQTVRTRTPRPDELTAETLEFLTEIDRLKRQRMQSLLSDHEVLGLLLELGYRSPNGEPDISDEQVESFAQARQVFRKATGRLFPSWSEVFTILRDLGYERSEAA